MKKLPHLVKSDVPYHAMVETVKSYPSRWLRIVNNDGTSYGYPYRGLINWVRNAAATSLTLEFTLARITLEGKKLDQIEQSLLDESVIGLHLYHPDHYGPLEEEQLMIQKMTIIQQELPSTL